MWPKIGYSNDPNLDTTTAMFYCTRCNSEATLLVVSTFLRTNTGADLDLTGRMLAKNGESGGCSPLSTSKTIIANSSESNVVSMAQFASRKRARVAAIAA